MTDDGTFVALARFESEEAAQRNSNRPEQGAWWEETAQLFTAEPTFHNSHVGRRRHPGRPLPAGFVQVMQGRSSDPDRPRQLMDEDPTEGEQKEPPPELQKVMAEMDALTVGEPTFSTSRTRGCTLRTEARRRLISVQVQM